MFTSVYNMLPLAQTTQQPRQHFDRFSSFCIAHSRKSLYFTMRRPFPLKIAASHGASGPHLIHGYLGPPESTTRFWRCQSHDCDRQTDRRTDHPNPSVTIGRVYVCTTIMHKKPKTALPSCEKFYGEVPLLEVPDQL